MALIGSIAVSIKTDTAKLATGLGKASGMVKGFAQQTTQAGTAVKALFATAAAGVATAALYKTVSAASSLGDAIQSSKALLGDASGFIIGEAQKQADAFGVSKRAFVESATSFGSMLQPALGSADAAAKAGISLAKLGQDIAAIKGLKPEEAFTAMVAALRGEFDPIERFGVFLKADAIAARAVSMGLAQSAATASDAAKKQATLAAIYEQTTKAQGFFAANAGRASNQVNALWGRVENLSASIGEKFLPIATSVLSEINTGLTILSTGWNSVGMAAVDSAANTVGTMAKTSDGIGWVQRSIGFVADAIQVARAGFYAFGAVALSVAAKVSEGLGYVAKNLEAFANNKLVRVALPQIGILYDVLGKENQKALADSARFFDGWKAEFSELATVSAEQMSKAWSAPWAHEGINSMFDAARARMAALQKSLATGAAMPSAAGAIGATAAKVEAPQFASAARLGSSEAANAILRSRYSAGVAGGDPAKKTEQNTKRSADLLTQVVGQLGQLVQQKTGQAGGALGALAGNF